MIEITTLAEGRSTKSIKVHRAKRPKTTKHQGLPVTTVAQTLLDLAATQSEHRLTRTCHRAEHLRLLDMHAVDTLLAEQFGGRGTARLGRAIGDLATNEPQITRTELEQRFLDLVAEAGLPRPEVNTIVEDLEVDFLWRDQRLIAETDGAATSSRSPAGASSASRGANSSNNRAASHERCANYSPHRDELRPLR